jgi:hypothetical protein
MTGYRTAANGWLFLGGMLAIERFSREAAAKKSQQVSSLDAPGL